MKLLSVTFKEDFLQPIEQVGNNEGQRLTSIAVLKFSSGVEETCQYGSLISFVIKKILASSENCHHCSIRAAAAILYKTRPQLWPLTPQKSLIGSVIHRSTGNDSDGSFSRRVAKNSGLKDPSANSFYPNAGMRNLAFHFS